MTRAALFIAPLAALLLSGCLAKAAIDLATTPVRAVGRAADLATTSQSEADETRGRQIREREGELGKLQRQYAREAQRCEEGERDACRKARDLRDEMDDL